MSVMLTKRPQVSGLKPQVGLRLRSQASGLVPQPGVAPENTEARLAPDGAPMRDAGSDLRPET
jgi:hypothetical protein